MSSKEVKERLPDETSSCEAFPTLVEWQARAMKRTTAEGSGRPAGRSLAQVGEKEWQREGCHGRERDVSETGSWSGASESGRPPGVGEAWRVMVCGHNGEKQLLVMIVADCMGGPVPLRWGQSSPVHHLRRNDC